MNESPTYLFVYGTLLKDAAHLMTAYLKEKSTFIAEGHFDGYLYKVDFFPGAVFDPGADAKVYGELFQLQQADRILRVLDEYEHYVPEKPEESLFLRMQVPIQVEHRVILAWTYLYNQATEGLEKIESGDFLQFLGLRQSN